MKKKIVCFVLALSIITSMASVAFASTNDNPRACSIVLLTEKINIK